MAEAAGGVGGLQYTCKSLHAKDSMQKIFCEDFIQEYCRINKVRLARPQGAADDGKRCYCAGSCIGVFFFFRRGGSLREGSGQIDPDRRPADDGKRCYSDGRSVEYANEI